MAYFPRVDELAVAANSRGLFEGMLVYCDRANARDLEFANGLDNLCVELLERTNERKLFITELEGLCPSAKRYKILKCLKEDKKQDLIHLLEIRKVILRKYRQREINADLQFAVGLSQLWDFLSELNLFGGPLAVQCAGYLKQLSKSKVLRMLELRKTIAEVHIQVHKKIHFLTVLVFC
uniref:Uncharacterized protein n=1 Tax=Tanacetum cinerariifolium TaxID=118510 RepID=A0A6L2NXT9_TANCI|nr:hypothetical protein [Tanacetum cinerariifolium]